MHILKLFTAGFLLALAMFVTTMLVRPPITEAAAAASDSTADLPSFEIVGP